MNSEEIETLTGLVEDSIEWRVDYSENHVDSGDGYAHLVGEMMQHYNPFLESVREYPQGDFIHAFQEQFGVDVLEDILEENFFMESGNMLHRNRESSVYIASFPLMEIEIQITLDQFSGYTKEQFEEACAHVTGAHIGSTGDGVAWAYVTSDCVWYARVSLPEIANEIAHYVGEHHRDNLD